MGLAKSIPVFFDSTIEGGTDPLIDFHNKLNQNLFQKKNLKILKRFYEPDPILTDRKPQVKDDKKPEKLAETKKEANEDPFEQANIQYEQKRAKKELLLNDEKTDYILEQRATAITTMTTKLHDIVTQYPLSKRIVVKPSYKIMRRPTKPVGPRMIERSKAFNRQTGQNNLSRTLDPHNTKENLSLTGRLALMQQNQNIHTTKSSIQVTNSRKERTGNSHLVVGLESPSATTATRTVPSTKKTWPSRPRPTTSRTSRTSSRK